MEPPHSFSVSKRRDKLTMRIHLHRVPEKFVQVDVTAQRIKVDTPGWTKKFLVEKPIPGDIQIDEDAVSAVLSYGILTIDLKAARADKDHQQQKAGVRLQAQSADQSDSEPMSTEERRRRRKEKKKKNKNKKKGDSAADAAAAAAALEESPAVITGSEFDTPGSAESNASLQSDTTGSSPDTTTQRLDAQFKIVAEDEDGGSGMVAQSNAAGSKKRKRKRKRKEDSEDEYESLSKRDQRLVEAAATAAVEQEMAFEILDEVNDKQDAAIAQKFKREKAKDAWTEGQLEKKRTKKENQERRKQQLVKEVMSQPANIAADCKAQKRALKKARKKARQAAAKEEAAAKEGGGAGAGTVSGSGNSPATQQPEVRKSKKKKQKTVELKVTSSPIGSGTHAAFKFSAVTKASSGQKSKDTAPIKSNLVKVLRDLRNPPKNSPRRVKFSPQPIVKAIPAIKRKRNKWLF